MAYFLKKTKLKNHTYLAIYESFYSPSKKETAHKCFKSLGSVETLSANGISDPVAHFQAEVDSLNMAKKQEISTKISLVSPVRYLGYFPLNSVLNALNIQKYINLFKITNDFHFDLYELLASLIFARSVLPCSKYKTFHDVLPCLFHSCHYSYDQLLDGLSFLGDNYEKIVELFTSCVGQLYGFAASKTYFDCTNFFFEIDREDSFRKKGFSKENKKDPIVGLGLLLDQNLLPIGMKMYPGNESEKPVLRDVITQLKKQQNITGKTIHVADKGLNCANNIAFSRKNGDGYLFSKSVKGLSEKEKVWVLLKGGFKDVKDKNGKLLYCYKSCVDKFPYEIEQNRKKTVVLLTEKRLLTYNPSLATKKKYEINKMVEKAKELTLFKAKKSEYGESAKYVNFTDKNGKKAKVSINQDAIDKDVKFAGYNLLVTSEIQMSDQEIYDTYHNLWRIEESFKIMKSDLDARPVYVQKESSIKGHFLICYLAVLLERIFQFKILENKYLTTEVYSFIKEFKVIKEGNKYINITTYSDIIQELSEKFQLPLTNYFLSEKQVKSIINYSL